jgi:tungstate transport system permease protein
MGGPAGEVVEIATLSLKVAVVATLVAALAGVPLGLWLGTARFRGRRLALLGLNTALAFPTVVLGLLVYLALSRRGPLGFLGLL